MPSRSHPTPDPPPPAGPFPPAKTPLMNLARSFDSDYKSDSDEYHRAATAVTTGWIVGIVFIVLAVLTAMILAIWTIKRNSRRRQERMAQFNAQPKSYQPTHEYQGPGVGWQPPAQFVPSPPATYAQPNHFASHGPPPRYEATKAQPNSSKGSELPV